jgi:hypothetical protein
LSHSRGRRTRGGTVVDAARVVELAHAAVRSPGSTRCTMPPTSLSTSRRSVRTSCSARLQVVRTPRRHRDRRRAGRGELAAVQGASQRERPLRPPVQHRTQAYELLAE